MRCLCETTQVCPVEADHSMGRAPDDTMFYGGGPHPVTRIPDDTHEIREGHRAMTRWSVSLRKRQSKNSEGAWWYNSK